MSTRQTIYVEGLRHAAPIPVAARKGPLLTSSAITGVDPGSGDMPEHLNDQVRNVFTNLTNVLDAAGADLNDVVKLTFLVRDRAAKEAINEHWLDLYPDPDQRPARHTILVDLPPGGLVQCELIAFCE